MHAPGPITSDTTPACSEGIVKLGKLDVSILPLPKPALKTPEQAAAVLSEERIADKEGVVRAALSLLRLACLLACCSFDVGDN